MSTSPPRKLTARRGSVSALDPLGKNASLNHDPNRCSSSILTIVRVVDPGVVPNLSDSPTPTHSRRSFRRHPNTSTSSSADTRLSFAFSSFSPISPSPSPGTLSSSSPQNHTSRATPSPSSSPRLRPSSPQFVRRNSGSGGSAFSKPNLTPEQLVDLARQSSAPRYVHPSTLPSNSNNFDTAISPISSPAKFTVLPLDVYLPFVDRSAETAHLLSNPPTKKLFSLLAQTFPTQAPEGIQDPFLVDSAQWNFNTLRRWLTEVDRSSASDAVWVKRARRCVLCHSELIWERLKGALGVPPELDLEDTDTCHSTDPGSTSAHQILDSIPLTPLEQSLNIEPILSTSSHPPSTPGTSNPPPSSLPTGLSNSASMGQTDQVLQDIVEDGEEEEPGTGTGDESRIRSESDDEVQIHGIRVCTSPAPSSEIGDSESERACGPVGDRIPGNPLFPSNFALLALGRPTLPANNPALRSPTHTTPRWTRWAPDSR